MLVPTTNCALRLIPVIDLDCTESTKQVDLSISLPAYVKVVTVILLPLKTVGGDSILLIEKINIEPLGAVLFNELMRLIC